MFSVSIIDWIGVIDDGIAVILSLMINDKSYEMMYWFNNEKFRITIDENFYNDYPKIKNLYEYEYLIDLIYHVDTNVLPTREEIFKTFNVN